MFKRHGQIDRPCLLGYIDKCSAPCVGRVDAAEHRQIVEDFCDFLAGRTDRMIRNLESQMASAAEDLDFERAARLRDDVGALKRALEKQAVVLGDGTDADVIAMVADDLEVSVQMFHVRGGRVRGQRGWVVERVDDLSGRDDDAEGSDGPDLSEQVAQFLTQFYGEQVDQASTVADGEPGGLESVPRQVLVPVLPPDADEFSTWLSGLRGAQVSLRVPQRGDKKALFDTVVRNAGEALTQHKLKRAGDLTTRSAALTEIQETLGLDERAAADRVHRHLPRAGHRRRRLARRVRGRSAPQVGLPALRHQGGRR